MGLGPHGTGPVGWWSPGPARRPAPRRACASSGRCAGRCARFELRVDTAFDGGRRRRAPTRAATVAGSPATSRAPTAALHELGRAHSVETWRDGHLVGGLYGVAIGGLFAGESMFHRETDASKAALVGLVRLLGGRRRRRAGCSTCSGARRTWRRSAWSRSLARRTSTCLDARAAGTRRPVRRRPAADEVSLSPG